MQIVLKILAFFIIISSCKSLNQAAVTKDDIQIVYGNSGGFTGLTETFVLKNNGELSQIRGNGKADTTVLKIVSEERKNKVFKLAMSDEISKLEYNKTGNLNAFITIYKNSLVYKAFIWPSGSSDLPVYVDSLYKQLLQLNEL